MIHARSWNSKQKTLNFLLAPANTVNFRDQVSTTDLNKFIDDNLQPTDEFNREMNESVEKICKFLREHVSPCEIKKVYSYTANSVKGVLPKA